MDGSTKDKAEGSLHDLKGTVKEKLDDSNDPDLEEEGTDEKIAGKIQKKVGGPLRLSVLFVLDLQKTSTISAYLRETRAQ